MRSSSHPVVPERRRGLSAAARSRTREGLIAAGLLLAAMIHLLPLAGLLGASMLQRLYGIAIDDPDLLLLLQHRALLFGLLGVALLHAALARRARAYAIGAALASTLSFLLLARLTPGINAALQRVALVDALAVVALLLAAAALRRGQG